MYLQSNRVADSFLPFHPVNDLLPECALPETGATSLRIARDDMREQRWASIHSSLDVLALREAYLIKIPI